MHCENLLVITFYFCYCKQVKDECLSALKERLLERANIIHAHLDQENQKLQQVVWTLLINSYCWYLCIVIVNSIVIMSLNIVIGCPWYVCYYNVFNRVLFIDIYDLSLTKTRAFLYILTEKLFPKQRQQLYKRSGGLQEPQAQGASTSDDFKQFYQQTRFRIQILQARAIRVCVCLFVHAYAGYIIV